MVVSTNNLPSISLTVNIWSTIAFKAASSLVCCSMLVTKVHSGSVGICEGSMQNEMPIQILTDMNIRSHSVTSWAIDSHPMPPIDSSGAPRDAVRFQNLNCDIVSCWRNLWTFCAIASPILPSPRGIRNVKPNTIVLHCRTYPSHNLRFV